ncbi:MAG: bifunctional demethylmenaquinone methyltransferase/2-methoxy-6-polyprenyl-1,4-benzoquinol methylase UbiE [Proteobacteria bacterium]|nr:bifunctional demethylmenaquinone methyltransferase/2-methoxy-6-polyprenyl-1,4-benzoquinol methylase UbiE [Pseudomonadota bacterium]
MAEKHTASSSSSTKQETPSSHAASSLEEKQKNIIHLFDHIAKRYDFLNRILSLRQDIRWRKKLLSWIPDSPCNHTQQDTSNPNKTLADVATGTGDVVLAARKKLTHYSHYYAIDLSEGMLNLARNKAQRQPHNTPITFILADGCSLPLPDTSADCLTISFGLRNIQRRKLAIKEFSRVLKPQGILLILEFFPVKKGILSSLFRLYFYRILPAIAGLFSQKSAYRYLPESVSHFISEDALKTECASFGLSFEAEHRFTLGSCSLLRFKKT